MVNGIFHVLVEDFEPDWLLALAAGPGLDVVRRVLLRRAVAVRGPPRRIGSLWPSRVDGACGRQVPFAPG